MFRGRLTRKLALPGNQHVYHLKIDALFHSNNFPSAQTGAVLRVVTGVEKLPLETRRHQPTIFTVRTENGRVVLDSYQPYSNETKRELEQRCFK